ncbi:S41 family peptidase [Niabella drilacis]|uniref:Carboxyl-terminal processing protease n=1 Tax=Niabella drilacis (strain DSM 25811 / CCM 8410 / CCUG 62505 / LMG 26954 / E90) TaxID=1285928 RepID=A0A1G6KS01_NIADE|nr:S41 family peptidase [Niabella drilacis]SDC33872.1 carboxyl-terminal processing protease [Niabella drilacis]
MKKKFEVWLPLLFSLVMIIGMFIGYKLRGAQPNGGFAKSGRSTSLEEALEIIRQKYVDSVKIDTLEANAIREMMNELDPHSIYLPPIDLKEANEELSGKFEGIGVEYNQIRDTVNITYVLKDGPSEKAGLKIGDQIIRVNDSLLAGKKTTSATVRNLIRGEKGTTVNLQILRNKALLTVPVVRNNIPTPTLVASYMIDQKAGYIKLDKFGSNTYREFMEAMEQLKKQGLTELVLDLRGNGGGYMDQAIQIADEFLSGDKLVVFTQGTNSPKKEYRCKRPGVFETGQLTVLVDELSASASEILTGALQDWDRATIIGRRTFGKGLVQEIFPLSDGAALKLTVSRYYTPLGRSIQRPYNKGKKVYMDDIWERYANGQAYFADSNKVNNGKQYKTPSGRILYGGGGIMPDIFVGLDTSRISKEVNRLFFNGAVTDFVFHYYLDHQKVMEPYTSPRSFSQDFDPGKTMWPLFVTRAQKDTVNLTHIPEAEKLRVSNRMEAYLARFKWRDSGYYQILNLTDSMVLKAVDHLKTK